LKLDTSPGLKTVVAVFLSLWLMNSFPVRAQIPAGDSLTVQKDTTAIDDTLRSRFIPGLGSITGVIDSTSMFHRSRLIWTDAKYFGDLAWRIPGFFLTDLGETGKPNLFTAFGIGGSGISINLDGRPLNDPVTGGFNLYDIPLEFIEQVEISKGSEGFLFGQGGSSATVNFVSRQFNSLRPITKIRYIQSQSETILTDILFTQNVARSLNLIVGFQRHASDGRYTNSGLDAWNLRTRLRYNVSDRWNFSLTDFYTRTTNGLNGGVDLTNTSSIYDNVAATVKLDQASEEIARRDVTLSIIAKPFTDSTSVSQASIYYTHLVRTYNDRAFAFVNPQTVSFWGIRLTQKVGAEVGDGIFGFDYQKQNSALGDRSHIITALFGKTAFKVSEWLPISLFGRYEVHRAQPSLSFGSNASLTLSKGITIFAGFNQFVSHPTLMEAYSSDTSIIRSLGLKDQRNKLFEAGVSVIPDSLVTISLTAFHRSMQDASGVLTTRTSASRYSKVILIGPFDAQIQGIAGSLHFQYWKIEGYGTLTFTDVRQSDTVKTLVPKLTLAGELSYRDKLFRDALEARIGLRSRFATEHRGMEFIPHLHLYSENAGPRPGQYATFDVFAILRIGDAQISLSWDNLLNTSYFISPIHPMPGRNFSFGVDWIFVD